VKLTTQQVARAGEHLVAAEIHLRGGYAATFAGNMPGVDLLAADASRTRTVHIQVKTRTTGTWHSNTGRAQERAPVEDELTYWVLVDLIPPRPEFYVAPSWWMENEMYLDHQAHLARHGGVRPVNPKSKHIGISSQLVAEWKDRWDILGIFLTSQL
jgi:hypothetical protein